MIVCGRCGRELPESTPGGSCAACRPPSQLERTVMTARAIGRGRVTRRALHLAREVLAMLDARSRN